MKIKELQIKNYKNLDATLIHDSDLIALIGNNGSGKSNLLEAISHIFRSLYTSKHSIGFDYSIEYITSNNYNIRIEKTKDNLRFFLDDKEKSEQEISEYLPKKVIGIYSGEETRLYDDCFHPFYLEYVRDVYKDGIYLDLPKMLYLNRFHWDISLLCLLISDWKDNKKFVKDDLNITSPNEVKVKIDFNKKVYSKYKNNLVLKFVHDIDGNSEYALTNFIQTIETKGYTPNDIFKYLYLAYTPKSNKIIDKVTVEISEGITVADLSEGEKKLILVRSALEFAGQEDTIFILDEPDAHIHLKNKKLIYDIVEPYSKTRQIILTSHSPTLTKTLPNDSIVCFESGKIKPLKSTFEAAKYLASEKDIYKLLFSQSNILIVEGKTDDKYISKAIDLYKDEYPELDFQILRVGGADDENIKDLIEALDLNQDQKIIILVDRDEAGYKVYKKLFPFPPNKTNFKDRKDVDFEEYLDNIYFLMAPHKSDVNNDGDFLIEDYFKKDKVIEMAKQHIDSKFSNHTPCKNFPDIRSAIKSELLPNFCISATKEDMVDFKVLLDKLKYIVEQ